MLNEQLVNWIEKSKAKGYNLDSLKDHLIQQGYSQSEVEQAINANSNNPSTDHLSTQQKSSKLKNLMAKKWVWIVVGVIVLIIIAAIILLPLKEEQLPAPKLVFTGELTIDVAIAKLENAGFTVSDRYNSIWQTAYLKYYDVFAADDGAKVDIDGTIVEFYRFEDPKKNIQKMAKEVFTDPKNNIIEIDNLIIVVYSTDKEFANRIESILR